MENTFLVEEVVLTSCKVIEKPIFSDQCNRWWTIVACCRTNLEKNECQTGYVAAELILRIFVNTLGNISVLLQMFDK